MNKLNYILFLLLISLFLLFPQLANAHPGRTDSSGCHTCRTNCSSWGLSNGQYHCHNGGTSSESTTTNTDNSNTTNITPIASSQPLIQQQIYIVPSPAPETKVIDNIRELLTSRQTEKTLWTDVILSKIKRKAIVKTITRTVTPLPVNSSGLTISPTSTPQKEGFYQVVDVVDGDTLRVLIGNKVEPLRILAMDTPETKDPRKAVQCFGEVASTKMYELVARKLVRLEIDHSQPDRDVYKRLLRYVYLEDGIDVGAEMVKQGYAFAYTKYPSDKLDEYRQYEKQARENNLGLWGSCQIQESGNTKSTNSVQ